MWELVKQEFSTQFNRYRQQKYGKVIAIMIYYTILTLSPILIQSVLPTLLQHMAPPTAYVVIVTATIAATQAFWCAFMFVIYVGKWAVFQQDRIDPQRPWPWEEDKDKWQLQLKRSIGTTAFNTLIFVPVNLLIQARLDFRVDMDSQNPPQLLWLLPQFVLMMLVEDFIFYSLHRLLHTPTLYKYHKLHHEFTNNSVSIAGLHFHVIEFFLIQSLSFLINLRVAYLYGPVHISTVVSWFIFRISDANIGHSGYNFSWAPLQLLPFCTNDDFHDFHHSQNSGNYGSHFRFWDTVWGTNKHFTQFKKSQGQRNAKRD